MIRRKKLVLWAIVGVAALATAWVVWPGVMAWRTRSEAYNAAFRQCLANVENASRDEALATCQQVVRQ